MPFICASAYAPYAPRHTPCMRLGIRRVCASAYGPYDGKHTDSHAPMNRIISDNIEKISALCASTANDN